MLSAGDLFIFAQFMKFVRPLVNKRHGLFPRIFRLLLESLCFGQLDPPFATHIQTMIEELPCCVFFRKHNKVQDVFYGRQISVCKQRFATLRQSG